MSVTKQELLNISVLLTIYLSVFSCGRVATNTKPSVIPSSSTPSDNPQPSSSNKPPNADPPDDGTGVLPNPVPTDKPQPSNPPAPDPQQPQTDNDFWNLMKRFGFTKTKEEITNDIKKQVAMKIADWSAGTVNNKQKNIENRFKESIKYFKPPIKDAKEYITKSMLLANKKDYIDYYLDVSYGPKGGNIYIQKIDAKNLEVLFLNGSGLITNYTKTDGALLKLAYFIRIPQNVYR